MTVPLRPLAPAEIDRELTSPAFLMPHPAIRHHDRIPPDVLGCMLPAWNTHLFPARPVRVAVLEDVVVAREGMVLDRHGVVIQPTIARHHAWEPGLAWAEARLGPVPRVKGAVVLCRMPGTANYGHFLCEMLPRAVLAREAGWADASIMVQAVPGTMNRVMRDSLALLGPTAKLLACCKNPVRVDRLVLIDGLTEHGLYMSALVPEILHALTVSIPAVGPERLLVTRPPGTPRRLAEPALVEAAADAAGFAVLDPATLPFADQVAAFKAARHVVSAMGAAMTGTVFCPPGATVRILAPTTMPDTFFWFIAGLRGLRHAELRCRLLPPQTGPASYDAALRVDASDLPWLFASPDVTASKPAAEAARQLLARVDPAFYLRHHPDVQAAGVDPMGHFATFGWKEGRAPSARLPGSLSPDQLLCHLAQDAGPE